MQEMPTFAASSYGTASSTYNDLTSMAMAQGSLQGMQRANVAQLLNSATQQSAPQYASSVQESKPMSDKPKRRLVQVLIVDPNDNIPLEQSLLYNGDQKLTDASDQELFFEIDVNTLLKKHNEARVKIVDKKVKERTEHLEPARIRDLKMVVVTVAEF